jgi:hypothetical protein
MGEVSRRGFLGATLAILAGIRAGALDPFGSTEASQMLEALRAVLESQDFAGMAGLLSDDFIYVNAGTADCNRAEFLEGIRPLFDSTRLLDVNAEFRGGVAEGGDSSDWEIRSVDSILRFYGYMDSVPEGNGILCERRTHRQIDLRLRRLPGSQSDFQIFRWEETDAG